MNVQIIEKNGKPEWAVIPFSTYETMVTELEMAQDIRDFDEAMLRIAQGEELVSSTVVDALLEGANPVRVWREYRGLTQQQLAESAGISKSYLSQIESGKRVGSAGVLSQLATALALDLDDLV